MRALAVVLLLASCAAFAGEDHALWPDLKPEYYNTLDEAAIAGLQAAAHFTRAYEAGGVIVQATNRKFRISYPKSDYSGDSVQISPGRTNDYAGYFTVGTFHTHPCTPYSHYVQFFSDNDVRMDIYNGTVGYMGDLCSGIVRRFVPGVTAEDKCWSDDSANDKGNGKRQITRVIVISSEAEDNTCGSTGLQVGVLSPHWEAVIEEVPGPKTKARGYVSW